MTGRIFLSGAELVLPDRIESGQSLVIEGARIANPSGKHTMFAFRPVAFTSLGINAENRSPLLCRRDRYNYAQGKDESRSDSRKAD